MKILVTGGTGFVGTHLVNALARRSHGVAVLARNPDGARNRYNRPVERVRGNVLDGPSLAAALQGRDAVIHLVGIIHEQGAQTFDRMHRQAAAWARFVEWRTAHTVPTVPVMVKPVCG